MEYDIADRPTRRTGHSPLPPTDRPDETLIANSRDEIRPAAMVEHRLQELLGNSPLPMHDIWIQPEPESTETPAQEMVGEQIDTDDLRLPPSSSFSRRITQPSKIRLTNRYD